MHALSQALAILLGCCCRSSEPWLAFIAMERSLRNLDKVRALYRRCYARQFADGSQVAFCQAWLRFEREEGRYAGGLAAYAIRHQRTVHMTLRWVLPTQLSYDDARCMMIVCAFAAPRTISKPA